MQLLLLRAASLSNTFEEGSLLCGWGLVAGLQFLPPRCFADLGEMHIGCGLRRFRFLFLTAMAWSMLAGLVLGHVYLTVSPTTGVHVPGCRISFPQLRGRAQCIVHLFRVSWLVALIAGILFLVLLGTLSFAFDICSASAKIIEYLMQAGQSQLIGGTLSVLCSAVFRRIILSFASSAVRIHKFSDDAYLMMRHDSSLKIRTPCHCIASTRQQVCQRCFSAYYKVRINIYGLETTFLCFLATPVCSLCLAKPTQRATLCTRKQNTDCCFPKAIGNDSELPNASENGLALSSNVKRDLRHFMLVRNFQPQEKTLHVRREIAQKHKESLTRNFPTPGSWGKKHKRPNPSKLVQTPPNAFGCIRTSHLLYFGAHVKRVLFDALALPSLPP